MDARLPEVPRLTEGRRKLTSMMAASSSEPYVPASSRSGVPIKYGPKLGPTGGNPLTTDEAKQIIRNSFPGERYKVVAPYEKVLIRYIVERSAVTPKEERRIFSTLDRVSKHVCNYEALSGNITRMETGMKAMREEEVSPDDILKVKEGVLRGLAAHLVDGYDIVDSDHFEFDINGNPVGVIGDNKQRKPLCYNHLMKTILDKTQSEGFRSFLQQQSDPFKGSQQGLGRTRKQRKHKQKKTLRRRKVRRNVH